MHKLAVIDTSDILFKEIEKHTVLTREQEFNLALRVHKQNDLEAAKKLILSNLRFVVNIAYEYASYGFQLSDLIQEGTLGLMRAVKKFNPHRGYRLISYAVWWIKAGIQNYIMNSWSMVKIGTTQAQRKLFHKISGAKKRLKIRDDDLKDDKLKQVADLFGVNEIEVLNMELRIASRDFSLDSESSDDDSLTYLDTIQDVRASQEEIIEYVQSNKLVKSLIKEGMNILSSREKHIINNRYNTDNPRKLVELGKELGISKERVRQIEAKALGKLRKSVEEHIDHGYAIAT